MSFSLNILLTIHDEGASLVLTKIISKRSQKINAKKMYHLILLSMLSADQCTYVIQQLFICLMFVLICYTIADSVYFEVVQSTYLYTKICQILNLYRSVDNQRGKGFTKYLHFLMTASN